MQTPGPEGRQEHSLVGVTPGAHPLRLAAVMRLPPRRRLRVYGCRLVHGPLPSRIRHNHQPPGAASGSGGVADRSDANSARPAGHPVAPGVVTGPRRNPGRVDWDPFGISWRRSGGRALRTTVKVHPATGFGMRSGPNLLPGRLPAAFMAPPRRESGPGRVSHGSDRSWSGRPAGRIWPLRSTSRMAGGSGVCSAVWRA
jgi:hypothetical protein